MQTRKGYLRQPRQLRLAQAPRRTASSRLSTPLTVTVTDTVIVTVPVQVPVQVRLSQMPAHKLYPDAIPFAASAASESEEGREAVAQLEQGIQGFCVYMNTGEVCPCLHLCPKHGLNDQSSYVVIRRDSPRL